MTVRVQNCGLERHEAEDEVWIARCALLKHRETPRRRSKNISCYCTYCKASMQVYPHVLASGSYLGIRIKLFLSHFKGVHLTTQALNQILGYLESYLSIPKDHRDYPYFQIIDLQPSPNFI